MKVLLFGSIGVEAREAIAIGDTEVCLPAALDAGIVTVATPNSFAEGQDFSAAIAVVDHLGDEGRAARTLGGRDIVRAGLVTLDSLDELLAGASDERNEERTAVVGAAAEAS